MLSRVDGSAPLLAVEFPIGAASSASAPPGFFSFGFVKRTGLLATAIALISALVGVFSIFRSLVGVSFFMTFFLMLFLLGVLLTRSAPTAIVILARFGRSKGCCQSLSCLDFIVERMWIDQEVGLFRSREPFVLPEVLESNSGYPASQSFHPVPH